MIINKATAYVVAANKVIKKGDPLPVFTSTLSGFVNGENQSVVTSLTYTLSPAYSGLAGTYQIIPVATAVNYNFVATNGKLYVNPYGSGAQKIQISLLCVEQTPPDPNGFTYVAHYKYVNCNSTDVFIPIGADNQIIGYGGLFSSVGQPELFPVGEGFFDVHFDGVKIKWLVKSYQGTQKQNSYAYAMSTSISCYKYSPVSEIIEEEMNLTDDIIAYPNPTTDKVYIDTDEKIIAANDVMVYDLYGKVCQSEVMNGSGTRLEIDFSALEKGVYFIRLNLGEEFKLLRIIKN